MRFYDISMTILIILLFIICFSVVYVQNALKEIKENWPKYKCNPMYMPLAGAVGHDPIKNFTDCIGTMQFKMMDVFLEPVNFKLDLMSDMSFDFMKSINSFRIQGFGITKLLGNITGDIFGTFNNLVVQFQMFQYKMGDIVKRLIGTGKIVLNIIESAGLTIQSLDNGPIGDILGCFPPDTLIEKKMVKKLK